MNELDAQRPSPQPQHEEAPARRRTSEVPERLSGLEWLARQAKRRRVPRRPAGPADPGGPAGHVEAAAR